MQNNIGTVKTIKTNKSFDGTKPQYKPDNKRHLWDRVEPSKRHLQETKH